MGVGVYGWQVCMGRGVGVYGVGVYEEGVGVYEERGSCIWA